MLKQPHKDFKHWHPGEASRYGKPKVNGTAVYGIGTAANAKDRDTGAIACLQRSCEERDDAAAKTNKGVRQIRVRLDKPSSPLF